MRLDAEKKVCTRCGKPGLLDEFPRDRRRRDGRGSQCKVCRNRQRHPQPVPAGPLSPQAQAWLTAVRRLITLHEDTFIKLLYSETVAAKLVDPTPVAFRKWWRDYGAWSRPV